MDINKVSADLEALEDAIKNGGYKPTDVECARFAISCLLVGATVKEYCVAMLAERIKATWAPGDRVQWTSGNGTVRVGTLLTWVEGTEQWFVAIDADRSLPSGDSFRTWFKPSELEPLRTNSSRA